VKSGMAKALNVMVAGDSVARSNELLLCLLAERLSVDKVNSLNKIFLWESCFNLKNLYFGIPLALKPEFYESPALASPRRLRRRALRSSV